MGTEKTLRCFIKTKSRAHLGLLKESEKQGHSPRLSKHWLQRSRRGLQNCQPGSALSACRSPLGLRLALGALEMHSTPSWRTKPHTEHGDADSKRQLFPSVILTLGRGQQ